MGAMPAHRLDITGHLSYEEIQKRERSCTSVVEREHWQVLRLMTRKGSALSAEEVAPIINRTPDAVRRIVRRYNKEGPDGLKDRRGGRSGRKALLTETQCKKLFSELQQKPSDGGLWTGPKVALWVSDHAGVRVSAVTGWQYLRRLGFTLQVPRPRHSETATEEERRIWKKNVPNNDQNSRSTPSGQRYRSLVRG